MTLATGRQLHIFPLMRCPRVVNPTNSPELLGADYSDPAYMHTVIRVIRMGALQPSHAISIELSPTRFVQTCAPTIAACRQTGLVRLLLLPFSFVTSLLRTLDYSALPRF